MNRINNFSSMACGLIVFVLCISCQTQNQKENNIALEQGLIGHWKLAGDTRDHSGNNLHAEMHGKVDIGRQGSGQISAASFNGSDAWLEVPASEMQSETDDFSVSAWIYTDETLKDVPGDIISRYDPASRSGFHLSLKSNATPTSHSNVRQLNFGVDNSISSKWVDRGKPGNALLGFGMAEYKGELYVGTCEVGVNESGHVYRLSGNSWVDCGSPDRSNSVVALAVKDGELYAGTGHYRVGGSSLPESENTTPGGRVFRYEAPNKWVDCGQLPGVETIGGMVVFDGKLYASSMYRPSALYRYEGGKEWVKCSIPDDKRVVNMAVYNGHLYATSWDLGNVYRYDGNSWTDCGPVGDNTQTYAFAVYEGKLYVASWPSGRVYRFDGLNQWADVGRLGQELEVMGMLVHNGRLLAGTLPLSEVYSYEGDTTWTRMDQLDKTPDVKYRRAWTMAEHDGKVFCSTLPSGKIFAFEAGKSVMSADAVRPGWQHVAATKTKNQLKIFINGKLAGERQIPASMDFAINKEIPLKIGFGSNDYFNGRMREIRLYNRALNDREIEKLADE